MTTDIFQFGEELVTTGDLDPIYMLLQGSGWDRPRRAQWSVAYWLFYHAGVACQLAEVDPKDFWLIARGICPTAPRGTERRHFRGQFALDVIDRLWSQYDTPQLAVDHLMLGALNRVGGPKGTVYAHHVRAEVEAWHGFGKWISFKVADMMDAVLDFPVSFHGHEEQLFDSPRDQAKLLYQEWFPDEPLHPRATEMVIKRMRVNGLGRLSPGHAPHRKLDVQEYETILCKWKSHLSGSYPSGFDTREIMHRLANPEWGPLAQELLCVGQRLFPSS